MRADMALWSNCHCSTIRTLLFVWLISLMVLPSLAEAGDLGAYNKENDLQSNPVTGLIVKNNKKLLDAFKDARQYQLGYSKLGRGKKFIEELCSSWVRALHSEQQRISPPPAPISRKSAADIYPQFAEALAEHYASCRDEKFVDYLQYARKVTPMTMPLAENVYVGASWVARVALDEWEFNFGSRTCPEHSLAWLGRMNTVHLPHIIPVLGGFMLIDGEPVFYEFGSQRLPPDYFEETYWPNKDEVSQFWSTTSQLDKRFIGLFSPTINQSILPTWKEISVSGSDNVAEPICLVLFRESD